MYIEKLKPNNNSFLVAKSLVTILTTSADYYVTRIINYLLRNNNIKYTQLADRGQNLESRSAKFGPRRFRRDFLECKRIFLIWNLLFSGPKPVSNYFEDLFLVFTTFRPNPVSNRGEDLFLFLVFTTRSMYLTGLNEFCIILLDLC